MRKGTKGRGSFTTALLKALQARWHSLRLSVHDLSEKQRQVIEMIFYQGLTQSDIAEILGWPLGTVKTRLRAAIEQLRLAWAE